MSVAYQSWEVASGPTMGYNMGIQSKSNKCSVPDAHSSDDLNYNGSSLGAFNSSESFLKADVGASEMSNGLILPTSKVLMPQDNMTSGFSALSLHSLQELEASTNQNMNLKWLSTNETTVPNSASQSAEYQMQARVPSLGCVENVGLENALRPLSASALPTTPSKSSCSARTSFPDGCHHYSSKSKLGVVVEEKALEEDATIRLLNDFDDDDLHTDFSSFSSTQSISSLHDMLIDGHTSSGDERSSTGEAEVQSKHKRLPSSALGASPPKKGLSQFYAGKSRSFSCLGDVLSLKDLAKPENHYVKKRKCNLGRSSQGRQQLPPLQKGVASISKKLTHNGKSTLALAVAMHAKDEEMDITCERDFQKCSGVMGRCQGSMLALRSYSLSDLQGVAGRCISPS